ncbi:MAG: phospholipase D family protein [Deltaproteobacteria bacterium]|nr:phospholipase D family protein [Deltaproteobacteria bacterium]
MKKAKSWWRKLLSIFVVVGAIAWLGLMAYEKGKPLPKGLSLEGPLRAVQGVEFLADCTFQRDGQPVREQVIFKRMCRIIDDAERFVLLDLFLFNSVHAPGEKFPALSEEMTHRLVEKKQRSPQVDIVLITDAINRSYGAEEPEHFRRLRASGVRIIYTDTSRLRDSNFLYSAWWRLVCQCFGTQGTGWLPSPFVSTGPAMTLRGYLSLFNFKANHRKVVASEKEALITSANPHDASAYHSNIAFVVKGAVIQDVADAETSVAKFSGETLPRWEMPTRPESGGVHLRLLTEGKIKSRLLTALAQCGSGCSVRMVMFYLSDREVIAGLLAAAARGAEVRLLLDPNKDAFGRKKNGIPNRPVAQELVEKSQGRIQIRWYGTHGEQFHSKLTMISLPVQTMLIGGSANLTRRNLDDLNLEADFEVTAPADSPVVREASGYFERVWQNQGGIYSLDFKEFAEKSPLKYVLYRFQEASGMGTF